jgi:hypothetical protein
MSGLYYKPMAIVNDDSKVINKLEASLTDNARVIIYERHMFIVQSTGQKCLTMKNTLAYHDTELITAVKWLIAQGQRSKGYIFCKCLSIFVAKENHYCF